MWFGWLMRFMCGYLWIAMAIIIKWWTPDIRKDKSPDPKHSYRRTFTPKYIKKKKYLYYVWCSVLVSMLIIPSLAYAFASALFTTFISFMILDEMD